MRQGSHYLETVLSVRHWTDRLFSFSTTRPDSLRFENGQFIMLGLPGTDERPLMRAYSFASANYEDELEFLSIKVPQGQLTSRLQRVRPGDELLIGDKPVGSLILQNLLPGGSRLYLLSTGTGLAPFLSLVKDPDIYERFQRVILVHGVRERDDLVYSDLLGDELRHNELVGKAVSRQFIYYPTVTREPFSVRGRITELIESGRMFRDIGVPPFCVDSDRVMLCGNMPMIDDMRGLLARYGLREGCKRNAGHFLVERAYVE